MKNGYIKRFSSKHKAMTISIVAKFLLVLYVCFFSPFARVYLPVFSKLDINNLFSFFHNSNSNCTKLKTIDDFKECYDTLYLKCIRDGRSYTFYGDENDYFKMTIFSINYEYKGIKPINLQTDKIWLESDYRWNKNSFASFKISNNLNEFYLSFSKNGCNHYRVYSIVNEDKEKLFNSINKTIENQKTYSL